jgi:hypothetical protein
MPFRRNNERNGLHIVRVNKALPATGDFASVTGAHRVFAAYFQERDVFPVMATKPARSVPEEKNEDDDRYRYAK